VSVPTRDTNRTNDRDAGITVWTVLAALLRRRAVVITASVVGCCALFLLYLHQSRTQAVDADGASNVLQAWDMLHGNLLLRDWTVSDVSFYTTELPQYMLLAALRGLHPDVVHLGGAMTYVLLILFAALLAKGPATGRDAVVRVLATAGIMLAPQLGVGTYVLLLNPAHLGTAVPVLVAWLVLDRARAHWSIPVLMALLLAWGEVADPLVTVIGAAPLALVAVVRLLQNRGPRWFHAALAAAAAGSVALSTLGLHIIRGLGGFAVLRPVTDFATRAEIRADLHSSFEDILLLFGADLYRTPPQSDFFGQPANPHGGLDVVFAVAHLIGLGVVALAVCAAIRRFVPRADLIEQLLVTAILIDLVAFMVRTRPDQNLTNSRQIVVILPFGAVLAGRFLARVVARRRQPRRLLAPLAVVLFVYAGGLLHNLQGAQVPAQGQAVADWLELHQLRYGIAGHWAANSITVASGNRVQVRSVSPAGTAVVPRAWESKSSWYLPQDHRATFAVVDNLNASYASYLTEAELKSAFGAPAQIHRVGAYTIYVWHRNLLEP
jgi:hypothetical protein